MKHMKIFFLGCFILYSKLMDTFIIAMYTHTQLCDHSVNIVISNIEICVRGWYATTSSKTLIPKLFAGIIA